MKTALILAFFLVATAGAQKEPKRFFVFRGFGIPLVQCDLVNNVTTHCRYISEASHPLDGVMEAIHRAVPSR